MGAAHLGVPPYGDNGDDTHVAKVGQDEIGVVSLVGDSTRGGAGFAHDRRIALHIGDLPAAQRVSDRKTQSVATKMDLV